MIELLEANYLLGIFLGLPGVWIVQEDGMLSKKRAALFMMFAVLFGMVGIAGVFVYHLGTIAFGEE